VSTNHGSQARAGRGGDAYDQLPQGGGRTREQTGQTFDDDGPHRLLDRSASEAPRLPRLLAGIPSRGALGLSGHLGLHGELPAIDGRGRSRRGATLSLIDEVERAGLRGRGGAGFPTAAKLRAVAGAPRSALGGGRPIVVVNGAEGEPASAKDRTLLSCLPHLVIDGALLAAAAVGAREVLLGVCLPDRGCRPIRGRERSERLPDRSEASVPPLRSSSSALDAVARALGERGGSGGAERVGGVHIQLRPVPDRYVAGHESALVNHLSGGPALPTFTPPRPFERGVRGRPTLVCNVETLAHLALIGRYGSAWFRELGTPEQPGSALVTLAGSVAAPGVYEIEHGSPLTALLDAADGLTARPRAALVGGYSGTWIDGSSLREVALSDRHLSPFGASLGAGVVVVLSADACPVAELARLTRWLASQSARQCGPCVFGLDAVACAFEQLAGADAGDRPGRGNGRVEGRRGRQFAPGHGERDTVEQRLRSLARLVRGRGACSHPDGVARLVSSALDVFAQELADHAHHGPCAACALPSELPRPRVCSPPTPVPT
jgi:NADH:ubiquinone oxidoreductase subunit F (NADH-binding)